MESVRTHLLSNTGNLRHVLGTFPLLGLPLAVALYIYGARSDRSDLRIIGLVLTLVFLAILAVRLAFPGDGAS